LELCWSLAWLPRIGYLGYSPPALERDFIGAFQEGLRNIGYVDGQNIAIEYRSAEGKHERFRAAASELVELNVDVIVTGATPGGLAAEQRDEITAVRFEHWAAPPPGAALRLSEPPLARFAPAR
jgi:ABC transporter substrate binding protein